MSYTFLCTFFSMKDCKIMTVCGFFCLLLILKMHSLASLISARFSLVVYWRVCAFLSVRFQFICVCCVCVLGVPRTGIEKFLSRHPDSCSHTHTHTLTHLLKHAVGNTYQNQSPKRATVCLRDVLYPRPWYRRPLFHRKHSLSLSHTHTHTHTHTKEAWRARLPVCAELYLFLSLPFSFFLSPSSVLNGSSDSRRCDVDGVTEAVEFVVWPVLWCVCVAWWWDRDTVAPVREGHISVTHSDMLS